MLRRFGPHAPAPLRAVFARLSLFRAPMTLLFGRMGNETNAMTRTTVAITTLEGSAGGQCPGRRRPGQTPTSGWPWGKPWPGPWSGCGRSSGTRRWSCVWWRATTLPGLAPHTGPQWELLEDCIAAAFPEALITPYIMMGGTDSRRFTGICDAVYRFAPFSMDAAARGSIHAVDEKITLETLERGRRLLRNADPGTLSGAMSRLRWHHDWDGHLPADAGPRPPDRRCPGALRRGARRVQQRRQGHARLDGGRRRRRPPRPLRRPGRPAGSPPPATSPGPTGSGAAAPGATARGLEGLHRPGEDRQLRTAAGLDRPVGGPGAGHPAGSPQDRGQGRRRRLPRHPADRTPATACRVLCRRRREAVRCGQQRPGGAAAPRRGRHHRPATWCSG